MGKKKDYEEDYEMTDLRDDDSDMRSSRHDEGDQPHIKVKGVVITVICIIVAIIMLCNVFTIVNVGHTGVIVTMGAVSDKLLTEGFHVKTPIQSIIQIDNRTQSYEAEGGAASKDLQTVTYTVGINYKVMNTSSAALYKNVGVNYESVIIAPAIQESVKAITAKYNAEQLITQRASVGDQIKEALQNKILPYGLTVEVFNIVNFDFSPEFNKSVEAKQTAQQDALKAEQDLSRIEIEAEQKVTQAQAEADSIKLIQDALSTSPDYIEYIKWSKWNGELPNVLAGTSDLMLDVGNVVEATPAQ